MHGLEPHALRFIKHALRGFFGLIEKPGDYESLMELVKGSHVPELFQAHGRYEMSDPALAAIARERYHPRPYDLDALGRLAPGSLGHEYAMTMKARGLSPEQLVQDFDPEPSDATDVDYLFTRRIRSHDIHHYLTNFDTSVAGELGVAAVSYVQTRNPVFPLWGAAALSHAILEPEWLDPLAQTIAHGYRIGRDAANLMAFKYEEDWERPVAAWREELHLEPAPTISSAPLEARWR